MTILHIVPCADEANGVYKVARLIAAKQCAEGHDVTVVSVGEFNSTPYSLIPNPDEVWMHGMWLPAEWRAMRKIIRAQRSSLIPKLIRMTHGSLSPIYLKHQSKWKKRLAGWLWERRYFGLCDRVVTTGPWETEWCRKWGVRCRIEEIDLRQFFRLGCDSAGREACPERNGTTARTNVRPLHVMYLGRRHPLKGVELLERAVSASPIELRVVSDHFGEELERDWDWCDVLCLPTLSENFGLVVAEALERGKRVITTDGAPAWAPDDVAKGDATFLSREKDDLHSPTPNANLIYLRGFREGTDETRVKLLEDALLGIRE